MRSEVDNAPVDEALKWAGRKIEILSVEVIRQNPWGVTSRLRSADGNYYLKSLPSELTPSISIADEISKAIPEYAPKVVSKNKPRGWLLLEDHKAHLAPSEVGFDEFAALHAYADLQSIASANLSKFSSLPTFNWMETWKRVKSFLVVEESTGSHKAKLFEFLGAEDAAFLADLLDICEAHIARVVDQSKELPLTLNHGDLHSNNFAVNENGNFKFHDWDNAIIGPAGLSLNSFCGSVARFLRFVMDGTGAPSAFPELALTEYCGALAKKEYCSIDRLQQALPGSALAGLFHNLASYDLYAPHTEQDRDVCVQDLRRIFVDIVECCFLLASESQDSVLQIADLLGSSASPEQYMDLTRGFWADEFKAKLNLSQLNRTSKLGLYKSVEINGAIYDASLNKTVPSLKLPWVESGVDKFFSTRVAVASNMFTQYGCLAMEEAFPTNQVEHCHSVFETGDANGFGAPLEVGNKRFMLPLSISGPFNSPEIYASQPLMAVLENVLGSGFVLGSMSLVVSEPGAEVQHLHMDHSILFPELNRSTPMPSHAVTVLIPLIDIDEKLGSTEVVKGSHNCSSAEVSDLPRQSRDLRIGDCLMFDYRLYHRGLANRSNKKRPVISLVYQRPWFLDSTNFHGQEPLQISRSDFSKVPDPVKGLFQQATIR